MSNWTKICKSDELAPGEGQTIKVKTQTIAIFRLENDEIHAIDDECPHAYGSLGGGMVIDDNMVVCPDHGWLFDVRTGICPNDAAICVRKFQVRQCGDEIQVCLDSNEEK
jgi:NAD(P)H-dependent nitrite reductase small subunit